MDLCALLLGERVGEIALEVQRAHRAPLEASGRMNVYVPYGALGNRLCRLLSLPQHGQNVPVQLRASVEGDHLLWVRRFGDLRVATQLRIRHGYLEERFGICIIRYRLEPQLKALIYRQLRMRVLGCPIPKLLAPSITALITDGPGRGWHVKVSVRLPLLGVICHYRGPMEAK